MDTTRFTVPLSQLDVVRKEENNSYTNTTLYKDQEYKSLLYCLTIL